MIIITGAAGFIGSALVWGFNKRGFDDIIVIDTLEQDERWRNLVKLRFKDFVHRDVFIEFLESGLFDDIEGIIHMGACTDTTERDADFLIGNNYEYTKQLAIWCIENNKRFVYASSGATYGEGKFGFSDDHSLLLDFEPLNMYGYSKHLFDIWAYKQGFLEQIAGLKYFNVFGPNEYHKNAMRSVVHKAFEQIRANGKVGLFKSYNPDFEHGEQKRDFIYVKDVVDMTIFIYEHGDINGIFNIGTGIARSFNDLVLAAFTAMNLEPEVEFIEMPVEIRKNYQYFTQADIRKLKKLDYNFEIRTLENAIKDYMQNYLLTEDCYL